MKLKDKKKIKKILKHKIYFPENRPELTKLIDKPLLLFQFNF